MKTEGALSTGGRIGLPQVEANLVVANGSLQALFAASGVARCFGGSDCIRCGFAGFGC